jgi:hypothetical protein
LGYTAFLGSTAKMLFGGNRDEEFQFVDHAASLPEASLSPQDQIVKSVIVATSPAMRAAWQGSMHASC